MFDPQLSLMREGRAYCDSRVCCVTLADKFMVMFVFMHILLAFINVIFEGSVLGIDIRFLLCSVE